VLDNWVNESLLLKDLRVVYYLPRVVRFPMGSL